MQIEIPDAAWATFGAWAGVDFLESSTQLLGLAGEGAADGIGWPSFGLLPQRGVGTILSERAVALTTGIGAVNSELMPYGWRLTRGGAGIDALRARDQLERDADDFAIAALGFEGPLWVTIPGPLTAWGSLFLPNGELVVSDAGAAREVTEALAHGAALFAAALRERTPGVDVRFIVEESAAVAALQGRLKSASQYRYHRPIEPNRATEMWQRFARDLGASAILTCSVADAPVAYLLQVVRAAELHALGLDLLHFGGQAQFEPIAEYLDAGGALWAGVVPPLGVGGVPIDAVLVQRVATHILEPVRRSGLDLELLRHIVVTPRDAGVAPTPVAAREVATLCRAVADHVASLRF